MTTMTTETTKMTTAVAEAKVTTSLQWRRQLSDGRVGGGGGSGGEHDSNDNDDEDDNDDDDDDDDNNKKGGGTEGGWPR